MTLAELLARKASYMAAEAAILQGQEYRIRDGVIDRWLRRADLEQVRLALKDLDAQIEAAGGGANGPRRMYRIVPGC